MRTRRRSIAGTMWLIFAVAIGLALARGGPEVQWLAPYWFLVYLGAIALIWLWFILVPKVSLKLAGGDRDRQRRILRWVVNTPFQGGVKVYARFLLGKSEQVGRHYDEAETTYRSILGDGEGGLDPGFESAVRQHLADTIDALGRREEAAAERERAAEALRDTKETVLGLESEGKLLDRQHRYAEAVELYEKALELAPLDQTAVRTSILMHLTLSSFNAGRPADTVRWAEAAIAMAPDGPLSHGARRMAAVGCSNLGRLDDAERHVRDAIERAPSDDQRAESLALLGDYVMRRGDLDEAERIAREAEAILPGKKRMPWIVLGMIDEAARDTMKTRSGYSSTPRRSRWATSRPSSRRTDAAIDTELAIFHAELGHGDDALALIVGAESEFAGDAKLVVSLDAAAALVHALGHKRDRALARIASAEEGRARVPQDGTTQRAVLYLLGRAALLLDEPRRAEGFLREYLDRGPDPVFHAYAWYHLGGCRRRLGDESSGAIATARPRRPASAPCGSASPASGSLRRVPRFDSDPSLVTGADRPGRRRGRTAARSGGAGATCCRAP